MLWDVVYITNFEISAALWLFDTAMFSRSTAIDDFQK